MTWHFLAPARGARDYTLFNRSSTVARTISILDCIPNFNTANASGVFGLERRNGGRTTIRAKLILAHFV